MLPQNTQDNHKKLPAETPPQAAILRLVEYLRANGYVITLQARNSRVMRVIEAA